MRLSFFGRPILSQNHFANIDQGLVIKNELYTIEKFYRKEKKTLKMQNGIRLDFMAYFINPKEDYGPLPLVRIQGNVFDSKGKLLHKIQTGEIDIPLGKDYQTSYKETENQFIELSFTPKLKSYEKTY